jgi:hypothetical protein
MAKRSKNRIVSVLRSIARDLFSAGERRTIARELRMGMRRPPLGPDRTPVKALRRSLNRRATDG